MAKVGLEKLMVDKHRVINGCEFKQNDNFGPFSDSTKSPSGIKLTVCVKWIEYMVQKREIVTENFKRSPYIRSMCYC